MLLAMISIVLFACSVQHTHMLVALQGVSSKVFILFLCSVQITHSFVALQALLSIHTQVMLLALQAVFSIVLYTCKVQHTHIMLVAL